MCSLRNQRTLRPMNTQEALDILDGARPEFDLKPLPMNWCGNLADYEASLRDRLTITSMQLSIEDYTRVVDMIRKDVRKLM